MHRHKILVQILLILSILNSVLAAPVVRVGEIPGAPGAVAVRVPAEGVVAVLEKRPFWGLWGEPGSEHPETQSTGPPEPTGTEVHHDAPLELGPPETEPEEVFHDASSKELKPSGTLPIAAWKIAAWKQKMLTPENIKALKYAGTAGLIGTAYLGLLLPTISKDRQFLKGTPPLPCWMTDNVTYDLRQLNG